MFQSPPYPGWVSRGGGVTTLKEQICPVKSLGFLLFQTLLAFWNGCHLLPRQFHGTTLFVALDGSSLYISTVQLTVHDVSLLFHSVVDICAIALIHLIHETPWGLSIPPPLRSRTRRSPYRWKIMDNRGEQSLQRIFVCILCWFCLFLSDLAFADVVAMPSWCLSNAVKYVEGTSAPNFPSS